MRHDVVLDTSAILNLAKDRELTRRFIHRARDRNNRVLLSYAAVEECLAIGHPAALVEFARWAVDLERELPLLFTFAMPHNLILSSEWRADGAMATTECDSRTRAHFMRLINQVLASPETSVEDFSPVRSGVGGWKERRRADDTLARSDLARKVKGKVLPTDYKKLP